MPEYKLLVLGTAGVGKSALTIQFVSNMFVDVYNPTVEDSHRKQVTIDNQCFVLNIIDTAGVEDFSAVRQHYTLTGHGFLIVYSIISKATFLEVDPLFQDILRIKDAEKVPVVIVGNKCDMEALRQVPTTEAQEYCGKRSIPFLEVSAKGRINVDEAFHAVVREIVAHQSASSPQTSRKTKKRQCTTM